jgi:peptidoglycan/LPS O-acetylase OafA/YrhL
MTEPVASDPRTPQLLQIDLIKAAAIVAVIVMHAMTTKALEQPWGAFHVWQAVPIFVVLLGMNAAQSARRRAPNGFDLSSYFRTRARRLLPVWIVVVLAVVGGLVTGRGDFRLFDLVGKLPLSGPGNYFIVIVVEFTLVFPLLWWCWRRSPVGTLVGAFALELAWHLGFQAADVLEGAGTGDWWFFYTSSLLHWIGGVALGMWLAEDPDLRARRNRWILVAAVPSVVYLGVFSATSSDTTILPDQQNVIAWPYAALLIMAGIKLLPAAGGALLRGAAVVGRASLHIFLVQMLWYGQGLNYSPVGFSLTWEKNVLPALIFSIGVGTVWWWVDTNWPTVRRTLANLPRRGVPARTS